MSHSIIPPAYGGEAYQIRIPYDEQQIEVDLEEVDPALREYLGLEPSEDDDESGEADDQGDDDASEADEIDGERETDEALRGHPNTPEQAMADGGDPTSDGGGDPI